MWVKEKKNMNDKARTEMIEPKYMMVGKEEVDHEHVSLLCSTQVGCPLVGLWYVLCTDGRCEMGSLT